MLLLTLVTHAQGGKQQQRNMTFSKSFCVLFFDLSNFVRVSDCVITRGVISEYLNRKLELHTELKKNQIGAGKTSEKKHSQSSLCLELCSTVPPEPPTFSKHSRKSVITMIARV
jgi:hypothetical protein